MGRAKARVLTMCLVAVNTYGYSPIKLLNKTKVNKDIITINEPLGEEGPIITFSSLYNKAFTLLKNREVLEGITQTEGATIKINSVIDTQFNDKIELVDGSKIENKFVIIFIGFLPKS
jgi:hypothetical protein